MALNALPRERIHLTEPLKNWQENQLSFLDLRNYEQVRLVLGAHRTRRDDQIF